EMDCFTDVILISDDEPEIIDTSTLEDDDIKIIEVASQIVNTRIKLKDKIDSNLMNENTGFYNDLTLFNNNWNVDTTEKLQEPNNQALQTFNVDDSWNTDVTDELQELNNQVLHTINESDNDWNTDTINVSQEMDLLTNFDHSSNSSYYLNSSFFITNELDNADD
ncbi:6627_t:CDS:2, partial [Cetraspora pellucida]